VLKFLHWGFSSATIGGRAESKCLSLISAYTVPYVRNNLLERAVKEAVQAPESEVAMEGNFIEIDGFNLPIKMAHLGRGNAV